MLSKGEYLSKLDKIPNVSFNKEQKQIAKKIIEKTDDKDLEAVYGLITQRVKTGFVFDEAPEVNHNAVAIIKENKDLGINVNELDVLEHKLIIGENYDALKNLCATYINKNGKGLIDVIYIDPPYNTEATKAEGNDYKEEIESSKFIYRDKFTRDGWLNMMNERLKLAKRLLSDTGIIFISIDDSEQAYLKVLCDEIFGEENFIFNIPRITKKGGKSTNTIQNNNDYLMCYTFSSDIIFSQLEKDNLDKYKYSDEFVDTRGKYALTQTLDYDSLQYSKTMDFEIIINNKSFIPGGDIKKHEERLSGKHNTTDWVWRWSRKAVEWGINEKVFEIKNNRIYTKSYLNVRKKNGLCEWENIEQTKPYTTLSYTDNQISNDNAKKEIDRINLTFNNPKPSSLIKELIKMANCKKQAIILDFFAGSGTTGQAVMELNEEDGGQRQFILVTNNENSIGENITRERLYRVINGKGSNGEKIEWTYTKDKPYLINNSVRVFNIETHELTLNDLDKAEKLKDTAKSEFKKLNNNCNVSNDFDIYNELSALNPQKKYGILWS